AGFRKSMPSGSTRGIMLQASTAALYSILWTNRQSSQKHTGGGGIRSGYDRSMTQRGRDTTDRHGSGTGPPAARRYRVAERWCDALALPAGLYVVATPIGNLGDVTLRALEILAAADLIACEDTRVTRKLLDRYGIDTRLTAYHDHNAAAGRPKRIARLAAGAAIALVSDAGTPLISDPGFKLVRAARDAGHAVTAAPGASAVMAALAGAGLPTDRFFFEGFLPARSG